MNDLLEFLEEPSLTKAQLVAQLRESMGLTQREARDLVDAFFGIIATRLSRGEEVKIANFGNFELRTTAPRPGRNPRTGEAVVIRSRKTVKFVASPKQIEQLQSGKQTVSDTKRPASTSVWFGSA